MVLVLLTATPRTAHKETTLCRQWLISFSYELIIIPKRTLFSQRRNIFASVDTKSVYIHHTLNICYKLHFRSTSGLISHCWLHCSPLTLATVSSPNIMCCFGGAVNRDAHYVRTRNIPTAYKEKISGQQHSQQRMCELDDSQKAKIVIHK
jgi:hypothetical protein